MCGIVGYIGQRNASEIIVDGLRRLEYRGYDSAGLVVLEGGSLAIRRRPGKIADLAALLKSQPTAGRIGLGHTRWATHGAPSEANAHPHLDCGASLAVVHNGIIENYLALKEQLVAEGHMFRSQTDTEVIAHLIEAHLAKRENLLEAVRKTLRQLRGAYALGVISRAAPDCLIVAKYGAGSVVLGLAEDGTFLASDIAAILPHTRDVVILEDGEVAVVSEGRVTLSTLAGEPIRRAPSRITWDATQAQKGGYAHFMLKEIHEQPAAVAATFRGRVGVETGSVFLPDANLTVELTGQLRRVVLVSCGTSYHAALIGRAMVERLAGLSAEVDIASEFRYRDAVIGPDTLLVAVSQSGETADTLGAAKVARQRGARILAITNVLGSALSREADGVIYTNAGPEIAVASTKTFTATLTACYLLGLALGLQRGFLTPLDAQKRITELTELPTLMTAALASQDTVIDLARKVLSYRNFLYMGRDVHYAVALEGALKLKEISYLHAEGYAAG
jgi:glucosamine--fructose-6-phosphate aminotransferase (isomerizing)